MPSRLEIIVTPDNLREMMEGQYIGCVPAYAILMAQAEYLKALPWWRRLMYPWLTRNERKAIYKELKDKYA